eukprot:1158405-Pelagomonas_calceolata.AAC.3
MHNTALASRSQGSSPKAAPEGRVATDEVVQQQHVSVVQAGRTLASFHCNSLAPSGEEQAVHSTRRLQYSTGTTQHYITPMLRQPLWSKLGAPWPLQCSTVGIQQ